MCQKEDCCQRNHNDEQLTELLEELDEGQTKLLTLGGALPLEVARMAPRELSGKDVARMIELSEE